MSFLKLEDKIFLISGIANKKSIAYFVAKSLESEGAKFILTVQNQDAKVRVAGLFPGVEIFILDVENAQSFSNFAIEIKKHLNEKKLDGFLHSIAFANYSEGMKPFHETILPDFLQATTISAYSLLAFANAIKDLLNKNASIVALSISNTRATNYGYMGPIKAMLDSSVAYLAKSLSQTHQTLRIRVNAVAAGPLKTSASAGIPGYINNYLFAEQLTIRHEALKTKEVADTAVFLLSETSSGINATSIVVDAGMNANGFDEVAVEKFSQNL